MALVVGAHFSAVLSAPVRIIENLPPGATWVVGWQPGDFPVAALCLADGTKQRWYIREVRPGTIRLQAQIWERSTSGSSWRVRFVDVLLLPLRLACWLLLPVLNFIDWIQFDLWLYQRELDDYCYTGGRE